jgi:hypothetical protein
MKKYLPLYLVQSYLALTLVVFFFGPIRYRLHNTQLFIILIVFYHIAFTLGYLSVFRRDIKPGGTKLETVFSASFYWKIFPFGMLGILITYKNVMLSDGIIPYEIIDNLIRGFTEPGQAYTDRMRTFESGQVSTSRTINVLSLIFGFAKLFFIFYFLYFWRVIGWFKRIVSVVYSLLFLATGISAGINSLVFLFVIFSVVSVVVKSHDAIYKNFRRVFLAAVLIFLLPLSWFGKIMSERGGGFEYFQSTSPLGDISFISNFDLGTTESFFGFIYYALVWLSYYVCQGYYGFSLILDLDWQWTYGFGNSDFLQRQFFVLFGEDISPLTFQARISNVWDKSAQWHSFYGQFANDFGVFGMPFFLFIVGVGFAIAWKSVLENNSIYGQALMPILAIMFIFIPANNQVFGYIDTLSYFVFVSFMWILENKNKN